ncbi:MAG: methyltransferase type 11 [Smithella sp. SDB]|nr:MAG: methyltransferase type 11 [Smithella sp. SDB]
MRKEKHRLCPVERAGGLDSKIRRWIQNPRNILKSYIKEGMTVLDVGCGPGFFSTEMAGMVGTSGRVIAVDLQDGMLQKVKAKIQGTELEKRITLHKSDKKRIGLSDKVDFVLAFYVVHELLNQNDFFEELKTILKPKGKVLIVEPLFIVKKAEFNEMTKKAGEVGFASFKGPRIFWGKTLLLEKSS